MAQEMSSLASEAALDIDSGLGAVLIPRRIRHITSLQVRNLTPFPVRDAFTSALSQPSDSQQSIPSVSDDSSAVTPRRRTRKTSTNSVATRSNVKWDEDEETHSAIAGTIRARKTSGSRVSFGSTGSVGAGGTNAGPLRTTKSQRPRTDSKASSTSSRLLASSNLGSASSNMRGSSLLPDNSQKGLEKVINSRLLETCLVASVLETPRQNVPVQAPFLPKSASISQPFQSEVKSGAVAPPKSAPATKSQFKSLPPSRHGSISSVSKHVRTSSEATTSLNGASASSPETRKTRHTISVNGRTKVSSPNPSSKTRSKPSISTELVAPPQESLHLQYLSPTHHPSTNPAFALGPGMVSQFAEWTDLNAQTLKVAIWGKMPTDLHRGNSDESESPPYPDEPGYHWRILNEWEVNLEHLVPIPDELDHPSDFPSNTLLIVLSPHNKTYRIPRHGHITSRASTPSIGYTSDPESELRKAKQANERSDVAPDIVPPLSRRRRRRGANLGDSRDTAKTATWPDVFQLATLQACIYDNNASLASITRKINHLVEEDAIFPLKREISERECRIADLNANEQEVMKACSIKRAEIQERRMKLSERRALLALASERIQEAEEQEREGREDVVSHSSRLETLRSGLTSIRTSLISILADIFPIELYSPPDLLFTILDVPLPIPISSHDPAPPLSVPEHKHINEETVATALGYVAQVLQLLAAYLGTNLIYPVTCIGSRSLIRDGISAMIGPRMFPLYSRGVDTYRFEYGVFLLNKNIDTLMGEKDLRALDLRHTLPNLKNLLLILSHDRNESSHLPKRKPPEPSSSTSSLLGLESPKEDSYMCDSNTATPKASRNSESSTDPHSPPPSGTTTPTPTIADDPRKARSFLALTPFAEFLRSRYPSSSRGPAKSSRGGSEGSSEPTEGVQEDADEEDRATVHGFVRDTNHVDPPEGKNSDSPDIASPMQDSMTSLPEPKVYDGHHDEPTINISPTLRTETS